MGDSQRAEAMGLEPAPATPQPHGGQPPWFIPPSPHVWGVQARGQPLTPPLFAGADGWSPGTSHPGLHDSAGYATDSCEYSAAYIDYELGRAQLLESQEQLEEDEAKAAEEQRQLDAEADWLLAGDSEAGAAGAATTNGAEYPPPQPKVARAE